MADTSAANSGGGGNFLTRKSIGGIPNYVLIGGGLVLLYIYLKNKGGSSASSTTPGNQTAPSIFFLPQGAYGVYPKGGKGRPPKGGDQNTREITVDKDETLGDLAKSRNWDQATITAVENMNVTQGSGKWTLDTELKKGQIVIRPLRG